MEHLVIDPLRHPHRLRANDANSAGLPAVLILPSVLRRLVVSGLSAVMAVWRWQTQYRQSSGRAHAWVLWLTVGNQNGALLHLHDVR
jgi:hypothetical protein